MTTDRVPPGRPRTVAAARQGRRAHRRGWSVTPGNPVASETAEVSATAPGGAAWVRCGQMVDRWVVAVAECESTDEFVARYLGQIAADLGWDAAAMHVWTADGRELELVGSIGLDASHEPMVASLFGPDSTFAEQVASGAPIVLASPEECREHLPEPLRDLWGQWVTVALQAGARKVGALSTLRRAPAADLAGLMGQLTITASLAGLAVERFRTRERHEAAMHTQSDRWRALYETVVAMAGAVGRDDLLQLIIGHCAEALDSADAWLMLVEPETGDLIIRVEARLVSERSAVGYRIVRGSGLAGHVLEGGEPRAVHEYAEWPGRVARPAAAQFQAVAVAPLRDGDRTMGVLTVADRRRDRTYSDDDLQTLYLLADQAATVLLRDSALRQAEALAMSQERSRLARDLHDGTAQDIAALLLRTDLCRDLCPADAVELAHNLDEISSGLQRMMRDTRAAILAIRTPDPSTGSIQEALRAIATSFEAQIGARISVIVTGDADHRLPQSYQFAVLRLVHEGLANVRKHARARSVTVELDHATDGSVRVAVADDGAGFDAESVANARGLNFGLRTVREQMEALGGVVIIESAPGTGTRLEVTLPPPADGGSHAADAPTNALGRRAAGSDEAP